MKIEKAIEEFLIHSINKNLNSKSIKAYELDLKQFLEFIKNEGIDNLGDIDKGVLEKFLKHISSKGSKTIKRKITVVKIMFNHYELEDVIAVNPFRKMKIEIKKDESEKVVKVAELSEIEKLFIYILKLKNSYEDKNQYSYKILVRDISIITILFEMSAKVSEISEMKKDDEGIDFSKGILKEYVELYEVNADLNASLNIVSAVGHTVKAS